ncbi:hypothetical protein [Microlunatus sp. Y2014]|uniref:hypothetical protein n=1 Tax=Microlunatus sp. Y2014 TaxID=3418488 RepID=UPI003DA7135B
MYNPFEGVKPSFGPFTSLLTNWVGIILALVWAAMLAYAAFHMIMGIRRVITSYKSHRPDELDDAKNGLVFPIVGVILLVMVPTIYMIVVANAGPR